MAHIRDFFGSNCPHCRADILQQAPSANRMPGEERAWCPSCQAKMTLDELQRAPRRGSFLKRLFGGPTNA